MFLSANVGFSYLLELLKLRNLSEITYYWNNFCNLNPALVKRHWLNNAFAGNRAFATAWEYGITLIIK